MIYIETGSTDVYFNFGVEYYFASVKQLDQPVFLFWRTEPTIRKIYTYGLRLCEMR